MLLKDKGIFIVEDNNMNRVVYQIMLRRHGAWIEFDRWGRDTLKKLHGFDADLIILDLMLPNGLSGFDIFEEIRSQPAYDNIPVVAVSASEPTVTIPQCREKGFAGFIAKPIDDQFFPQQLARILDGETVWYAGERYGSV